MLALGATNLVAAVLFATLYAVAGARYLSDGGFLACLAILFAFATVAWVRTESRHAGLEPVRRLGRVAAGLAAVLLGVPIAVLMPLFWLESSLPPEAGLTATLAPTMTLVLISLALTVLVNVAGGLIAGGRGLAHRAGRRSGAS